MADKTTLAERTLLLQRPDGERDKIVVRLGAPYWVTRGEEAACSVEVEGLYETLPDVHGVDLYQALELAIQLTNTLLMSAHSKRQKLLWPDGKPYEFSAPSSPRKKSRTTIGVRAKKTRAKKI